MHKRPWILREPQNTIIGGFVIGLNSACVAWRFFDHGRWPWLGIANFAIAMFVCYNVGGRRARMAVIDSIYARPKS